MKRSEIVSLAVNENPIRTAFTSATKDNDEQAGTFNSDKIMVYPGAVWSRGRDDGTAWKLFTPNGGHLGELDDPSQTDRLHGLHKYTRLSERA